MRLSKHWYLVKRPYERVTKRARKFISKYPPDNGLNNERSLQMRRVGYEDGYAACLMDLGIKQTGESMKETEDYYKNLNRSK